MSKTSYLVCASLLGGSLLLTACSSNPKKMEKVETEISAAKPVDNQSRIGKKSDGTYVVQEKKKMVDHLVELQRDVDTQEQTLFGNRGYGNIGKHGVLENCLIELRGKTNKEYGMIEVPEKNLLTQGENKSVKKAGVDETGELILLSEEEITDRINRFESYQKTYSSQLDWYDTEIKNCKLKMRN